MTNGRTYSEMLEAAQRKLVEAQFFYRRLVTERDGRLVESEAGAFRHYLSAFLSAGESVRYVLRNADDQKYTNLFGQFPKDTDGELLKFMNLQRGEENSWQRARPDGQIGIGPSDCVDPFKPNSRRSSRLRNAYFLTARSCFRRRSTVARASRMT